MTVNELIEKLQALSPEERERPACYYDDEGFTVEIDQIDLGIGKPNRHKEDCTEPGHKIILLS